MENFSCFGGNLSSNSVTPGVWNLDPIVQHKQAVKIVSIFSCVLFTAVGLPWNLFLMANIIKRKLYQQQPTAVLLLNLAFINILVCLLVIPISVATGIKEEFSFGSSDKIRCMFCQTGVIFLTLIFAALNNFALMSVDRLIYLKMAMYYHSRVTAKRMILLVIAAWSLSILVSFPTLFGFGELSFSKAIGICTVNFSGMTPVAMNFYYLLFGGILVLVPLIVLVVTNTWVFCIAQRHIVRKLKKRNTQRNQQGMQEYSIAQTNLIKVYAAVFVTYIITWFPIVVRLILGVAAEDSRYSEGVQTSGIIAYLAILSQVVLHPTLQVFLTRDVRLSIINCMRRSKRNVRGNLGSTVRRLTTSGVERSSTSTLKSFV